MHGEYRTRRRPVRRATRIALVAAAVLLPLGLAACGSSPKAAPPPSAPTTSSSTGSSAAWSSTGSSSNTSSSVPAATTSTAPGTPTPVYQVGTGKVGTLGTVLVDGQGFTLYLFIPDHESGKSTCYGPCASAWPPLLLPAGVHTPLAGPGVKTSLLGTTTRSDGTTQLTYNGWPLYLWVNDSQPGVATGQGLNNLGGLWYVVSPNGHAILRH